MYSQFMMHGKKSIVLFVCRFYFPHLSVSLSITQYQHCHTKVDTKPNFRLNIDIRH